MSVYLVVGDSIAKGVGTLLKGAGVLIYAKIGASSAYIEAHTPHWAGQAAVISAGSNDGVVNPETLRAIRRKISAGRVVWVLPFSAPRAAVVIRVAREYGDRTAAFGASHDHVHPASYPALVATITGLIR